jgi:hypothetical protein
MNKPEVPDFSAVPHAPRRARRTLAVAGFASAVVLGAVGATAFAADQRGATDDVRLASVQTGLGADGDPGRGHHGMGGPGGPGMMGPRGALHGELVVPQRDGTGTQTVVVQSGTVTAVSATSLSVKSSDGYTATYVITSSTRVAARSGGITSLKKGDEVHVAATKSGSTSTALMVGARPDRTG